MAIYFQGAIMEFSTFGLDAGIIGGIVGIGQLVKRADVSGKWKRFYIFIPLVLGAVAGAVRAEPFTVGKIITGAISYAGVSAYAFDAVKKLAGK